MTRKDKIKSFISDESYTPMNIKEIMCILCVPKQERDKLNKILDELESDGIIIKNRQNKYMSVENSNLKKGVFYSKSKGYGFVITDVDEEKFYIAPSDTKNAYNKDSVLIRITRRFDDNDSRCSEGQVVKILSHSDDGIVGVFYKERNFGFVVPDNKSFGSDIYIPKKYTENVKNGQKVVVKIEKWPDGDKNPEGKIEEIIGYPNEKGVDILSVIREYGFEEEFSYKAELSALSYGDRVYEDQLDDRKDFRDHLIFTIDGDDSKDFDDAVEIEKTSSGYRLGVHIADVSYYVSENSVLDIEARKRGTSVYFPDKVIPMLPKRLSNGICSLNPECDRLTLSVIMDFDSDGAMTNHIICESVIQSKYRMTYNNVTKILSGDENLTNEYKELNDSIQTMNELSQILRKRRMSKGSIDFDFPEIKVKLDENGKAVDVYKYYSTEAHKIIEEFMLAANTCVAEEMHWSEIPFIYRIHEKPSPSKTSDLASFLGRLGLRLKGSKDSPHSGAFADVLKTIKGSEKEAVISKYMLRTLMKAKYSTENCGHFGLAFPYYCHFTSPIRRYPDLVIHRIIKEHLKYGITDKRKRFLQNFAQKAAKSSSDAEIRAMEAEREVDDMKKAEFMSQYIGKSFPAVITSVTSFGVFCQTEFGIEGLISMTDLDDDYYLFDEKTLTLNGKHTSKTYAIGDEIKICVKKSDPVTREIDFIAESGEII